MAQIKLYRSDQEASLSDKTIEDGAIYIISDDEGYGKIYADFNNQRIELGSSGANFQIKTTQEYRTEAMSDIVSKQDVLYVISDAYSYENEKGETVLIPGLKLGNGQNYVIDLPDINANPEQINLWNHKVSCFIDPTGDDETLIFSKRRYIVNETY